METRQKSARKTGSIISVVASSDAKESIASASADKPSFCLTSEPTSNNNAPAATDSLGLGCVENPDSLCSLQISAENSETAVNDQNKDQNEDDVNERIRVESPPATQTDCTLRQPDNEKEAAKRAEVPVKSAYTVLDNPIPVPGSSKDQLKQLEKNSVVHNRSEPLSPGVFECSAECLPVISSADEALMAALMATWPQTQSVEATTSTSTSNPLQLCTQLPCGTQTVICPRAVFVLDGQRVASDLMAQADALGKWSNFVKDMQNVRLSLAHNVEGIDFFVRTVQQSNKTRKSLTKHIYWLYDNEQADRAKWIVITYEWAKALVHTFPLPARQIKHRVQVESKTFAEIDVFLDAEDSDIDQEKDEQTAATNNKFLITRAPQAIKPEVYRSMRRRGRMLCNTSKVLVCPDEHNKYIVDEGQQQLHKVLRADRTHKYFSCDCEEFTDSQQGASMLCAHTLAVAYHLELMHPYLKHLKRNDTTQRGLLLWASEAKISRKRAHRAWVPHRNQHTDKAYKQPCIPYTLDKSLTDEQLKLASCLPPGVCLYSAQAAADPSEAVRCAVQCSEQHPELLCSDVPPGIPPWPWDMAATYVVDASKLDDRDATWDAQGKWIVCCSSGFRPAIYRGSESSHGYKVKRYYFTSLDPAAEKQLIKHIYWIYDQTVDNCKQAKALWYVIAYRWRDGVARPLSHVLPHGNATQAATHHFVRRRKSEIEAKRLDVVLADEDGAVVRKFSRYPKDNAASIGKPTAIMRLIGIELWARMQKECNALVSMATSVMSDRLDSEHTVTVLNTDQYTHTVTKAFHMDYVCTCETFTHNKSVICEHIMAVAVVKGDQNEMLKRARFKLSRAHFQLRNHEPFKPNTEAAMRKYPVRSALFTHADTDTLQQVMGTAGLQEQGKAVCSSSSSVLMAVDDEAEQFVISLAEWNLIQIRSLQLYDSNTVQQLEAAAHDVADLYVLEVDGHGFVVEHHGALDLQCNCNQFEALQLICMHTMAVARTLGCDREYQLKCRPFVQRHRRAMHPNLQMTIDNQHALTHTPKCEQEPVSYELIVDSEVVHDDQHSNIVYVDDIAQTTEQSHIMNNQ